MRAGADLILDRHPGQNALARFLRTVLNGHMVSRQNIKRYCNAIAAAFKPERVILFGSHANGQPDEDSDVDVLVVMRNARRLGRHPAAAIRMKGPSVGVRATIDTEMGELDAVSP